MIVFEKFLMEKLNALEEGNIIPKLDEKQKEEIIEVIGYDDKFFDLINQRIIERVYQVIS